MRVLPKRNIVLRSPCGGAAFPLRAGVVADLPEWAEKARYTAQLLEAGKIVQMTEPTVKSAAKGKKEKNDKGASEGPETSEATEATEEATAE